MEQFDFRINHIGLNPIARMEDYQFDSDFEDLNMMNDLRRLENFLRGNFPNHREQDLDRMQNIYPTRFVDNDFVPFNAFQRANRVPYANDTEETLDIQIRLNHRRRGAYTRPNTARVTPRNSGNNSR